MRGRLIHPFLAEFARLDAAAMAEDVDPDFREPPLAPGEPDAVGPRVRRELAPVRVPCQVEVESFEALRMMGAGNAPRTRVELVLHFRDLERLELVDPATGSARLGAGDRLIALYDRAGTLVQTTPGLFVVEARPIGFGLGLARAQRNLLLLVLEGRQTAERGERSP